MTTHSGTGGPFLGELGFYLFAFISVYLLLFLYRCGTPRFIMDSERCRKRTKSVDSGRSCGDLVCQPLKAEDTALCETTDDRRHRGRRRLYQQFAFQKVAWWWWEMLFFQRISGIVRGLPPRLVCRASEAVAQRNAFPLPRHDLRIPGNLNVVHRSQTSACQTPRTPGYSGRLGS